MAICYLCKGEAAPGSKDLLIQWGEEPVQITGVPAEICQECGHAWFDPDATEEISRILRDRVGRTGERKLPIFSFAAARAAA